MQTEVAHTHGHTTSYPAALPRHPLALAVADLVRPHASMLDQAAARGRLRDALTSYVRTLRADGAAPSDVFALVNAAVRHALAGIAAPARLTAEIRDTIRRWARAAYDRAD